MRGHIKELIDNRQWTNSTVYGQIVNLLRQCFSREDKESTSDGPLFPNLYEDIKCLKILSQVDKYFDEDSFEISLDSLVIFAYALKRNQIVNRLLSHELFKKVYLSKKSPFLIEKGYDDGDEVIDDNTSYYHDVKTKELFNILLNLEGKGDDVILNDEQVVVELARLFKMDRDYLMDYADVRELTNGGNDDTLIIEMDHFKDNTNIIWFDDEITVVRRMAKLHEEYTNGLALLEEAPFKKFSWMNGPELVSIAESAKVKLDRTYFSSMILEMASILSGKFIYDQYHSGCEWLSVRKEDTIYGRKIELRITLL